MKKLSEVVNVVPVIAKADSLTLDEREVFKAKVCSKTSDEFKLMQPLIQIRAEFEYHNIQLYPFDSEEHDDEEVELNQTIKVFPHSLKKTSLKYKNNRP